jgi:molybdopterin converting factor small subunit
LKVLFYGRLADFMGGELEVDGLASCSIAELRHRLVADHPNAQEALEDGRVRACVRGAVVDDQFMVTAAESVEFLPPVSGG